MKLDRAMFLLLAASLATVACTATGGEDTQAGNDAFSKGTPAAAAAGPSAAACWNPATDLVSGAAHDAKA